MDNRWISREQLEIVICLRSIESSLFFSFGASKWCFLGCTDTIRQFVKDDDDIGRVSGSKFESSEGRY